MRTSLAALLTGVLVFLLAKAGIAQQQEYWIQLESHTSRESALERARELSSTVPDLRGIRTSDGRFVLAIGKFEFAEARSTRVRLSNAGAIPVTSRVTDQIDPASFFWPGANRFSPIDQQPSARLEYDDGEKLAIQTALRWFNEYSGAIDGIFGSGTKGAILSYQENQGFEPTGVLTREQATVLLGSYNTEVASIRMHVVEDDATGISIAIPRALVRFSAFDAPFVIYDSISEHGMALYLVSMQGNRATLGVLRDIFLNSEFLPGGKVIESGPSRFSVRSADTNSGGRAFARLNGNRLKGFAAVWNIEHDDLMQRILNEMQSGFRESHEGTLDPELTDSADEVAAVFIDALPRVEALKSASGFYIDMSGMVATTATVASGCHELYAGADEPMSVRGVDLDLDLAVLAPVNNLSPIAYGSAGVASHSRGRRIAVSGYSYGGDLGFPTMTEGSWIGPDIVTGNSDLALIKAPVLPGDIGGPVFDSAGRVVGMLRPPVRSSRTLPDEVNHVVVASAIWRHAAAGDTAAEAVTTGNKLDPADLARHAQDITVLVQCFGSG